MGNNDIYLGNPNLKKANTRIEFTQDQIEEFIKCKEDPVYFAKNYIKIVSLDEGLVPFNLYKFQEKLIQRFHENRFNICKMPRQTGKSTTVVSYLVALCVVQRQCKHRYSGKQSIHCKRTTSQIGNCIREPAKMDATGYSCMEQRKH